MKYWAETIDVLQTPLPMPCHIGIAAALKELSGKVDIMIDGDGADTVFGGGFWPQMIMLSKLGGLIPIKLRKHIREISQILPTNHIIGKAFAMGFEALGTQIKDYPHYTAVAESKNSVDAIFGKGVWEKAVKLRSKLVDGEFYEALFSYLMLHGIPQDVATTVRLAFHHNILFYYPFLDYSLLKDSMRLSNELRYHYKTKKAVLKDYCLNYFNKDFVFKPKEGFGVPLAKWYTTKPFEPFIKLPLEERSH